MKLVSFEAPRGPRYGAVDGDEVLDLSAVLGARHPSLHALIRHGALDEARQALTEGRGPRLPLAGLRLLPPIEAPEKIWCIGVNYPNRLQEYADSRPAAYPSLFTRAPSSLRGHGAELLIPPESEQLDYEGEIVLVIGLEGRRITRERAHEHVFGLTLCNEGTVRDWLRHGKFNVTQGKNFDASGSVGPWIVSCDELPLDQPLTLSTRVNGELRQQDSTARLSFGFDALVAYLSTFATLKPGDLIVTGTPTGAGAHQEPPRWLRAGDVVEVEVPQIGVLRNTVAHEVVHGA